MIIKFRGTKWLKCCAAAFGLAIFSVAASADGQTTTIVNDSFADGISNSGPQQIGFFTTSSSSGLDQAQAAGPIDFASGSSGRAIHGTFAPTTLSNAGDRLDVTIDFTTPTTIAPDNNEVIRFALFDTAPAAGLIDPVTNTPPTAIDFNNNITSGSSFRNTALNALPGFSGEIDDINAQSNANIGTSDIIFRSHNVNNFAGTNPPTGRLLTTTDGFDNLGSAADDQFLLLPNTSYSVSLSVVRDANGDFDLGLDVLDASGNIIGTHSDTAFGVDDLGSGQVGINTDTFDLLGVFASGGAFGSSNSTGDPDNGIDINNVTITTNVSAVPEPSSALLLAGLGVLGLVRRRK